MQICASLKPIWLAKEPLDNNAASKTPKTSLAKGFLSLRDEKKEPLDPIEPVTSRPDGKADICPKECPAKVDFTTKRGFLPPFRQKVAILAIDGKKPVVVATTDPLAVEIDDIAGAIAQNTPKPHVLLTPFMGVAGIFSFISSLQSFKVALRAAKNISTLWHQIRETKSLIESDTKTLNDHLSYSQNGNDFHTLKKDAHRLQNLKAYLQSRQNALFRDTSQVGSSMVTGLGTLAQFAGIVTSGTLFGSFAGMVLVSPFLLSGGLLAVGAVNLVTCFREVAALVKGSVDIEKKLEKETFSKEVKEKLLFWHKKTRQLSLWKAASSLILASGCLALGLATLSLLANPFALMVPAVILTTAGIFTLVMHFYAKKKHAEFHQMLGGEKRFMGSKENISNHILFAAQNRRLMEELGHEQGRAVEKFSAFLSQEAHLRAKYKPHAKKSFNMFVNYREPTENHVAFDRIKEYLNQQGLLKETASHFLQQYGDSLEFSFAINKKGAKGALLLDPHKWHPPVSSEKQEAFQESFTRIAIEIIGKKGALFRCYEERELIDHLNRQL